MSRAVRIAETVFKSVTDAMQDAEEIGGPRLDEYVALMRKIAEEANRRADTAITSAVRSMQLDQEKRDDYAREMRERRE